MLERWKELTTQSSRTKIDMPLEELIKNKSDG
jgi:hypothetical protein